MKLYLSSIRIPAPQEFKALVGKPFSETTLALIPNANDFLTGQAREDKVSSWADYFRSLGFTVDIVDLRNFDDTSKLKAKLQNYDVIWAMGGNTFCLRYEMQRSGFEAIIVDLLNAGIVYGGDSAGALVAGEVIGGIGVELADEPESAKEVINEGLGLVPYVVMPHVDNPEFTEVLGVFRNVPSRENHIELKDSQAVIFDGDSRRVLEGQVVPI